MRNQYKKSDVRINKREIMNKEMKDTATFTDSNQFNKQHESLSEMKSISTSIEAIEPINQIVDISDNQSNDISLSDPRNEPFSQTEDQVNAKASTTSLEISIDGEQTSSNESSQQISGRIRLKPGARKRKPKSEETTTTTTNSDINTNISNDNISKTNEVTISDLYGIGKAYPEPIMAGKLLYMSFLISSNH